MKDGSEQTCTTLKEKIKIEQIYGDVPNDIWQVIFAHLPPSFLGMVRQVSTEWCKLVQDFSKQSLDRYFSYLIYHPDYRTQPLSLFIKEYQRYCKYFSDISMEAILSALQGNIGGALSGANLDSQSILYGLCFAKGYPLPEKDLSEESTLEIKGWAVFFAVWQGNTQLLDELLILPEIDAQYKSMTLWFAAQNGDAEAIAKLAASGADVNKPNGNGATPTFVAAQNGYVAVIAKLAALGANLNTPTNDGTMPIHIAARNGHIGAVAQLVESGVNINNTPEVITQLVESGVDINTPMANGATLIYIATEKRHVSVVAQLAALGANVNRARNDGITPMYLAAEIGDVEMIAQLAELGADVNLADNNGVTPAYIAAEEGYVDVITQLAARGADVNRARNDGATPIFVAIHNKHTKVIAKLIELGVDIDTPMNDGTTPVFIAAESGSMEVITQLMALGANVNPVDNGGVTPIFIAAQHGHAEVVQFLLNLGVKIQPYIASVESLSDFAKFHGGVVIDRMERYIQEKIQDGNPIENIPLLPIEIADIMGYDEIVDMFKASSDVNHKEVVSSQSPTMTFAFNAGKDNSSSSSEENTTEIDKDTHEELSFLINYCRQM